MEFLFNVQETISWLEKQANIPHFTFDDILALQCAMKATEKADNELYEQLKSLHDRLHDVYWLEKQGDEPNWCHHKVDLSNCSEEYRKAYYDGWNNCNQQHVQLEAEQKPWSEEDERMLDEVIKHVRNYQQIVNPANETGDSDLTIWLKSLRPQPHWKPSEQNIKDLEWCADLIKDKMGVGFHRLQVFIDEIKNL